MTGTRKRIFFALSIICSMCVAQQEIANNTNTGDESGSARILEQEFTNDGSGPYKFHFKTSNGISRDESAELIPSIHDATKDVPLVKGTFSYPGPDGVLYNIAYVADESGFHPEGDHFQVPPFTPWIPGQPIDDGKYKADNSGQYKADNSGQYKPETFGNNENQKMTPTNPANKHQISNTNLPVKPNNAFGQPNFPSNKNQVSNTNIPVIPNNGFGQPNFPTNKNAISNSNIPVQPNNAFGQPSFPFGPGNNNLGEINPTQQKPTYTSGESILDATLPQRNKVNSIPTSYIPVSLSANEKPAPIPGQDISEQYRKSVRVTTEYLPPSYTTSRPNVYSTNAYPNNLETSENSNLLSQYRLSSQYQNTNYVNPTQYRFPQPFSMPFQSSLDPLNEPSEEGEKYARSVIPENQIKNHKSTQKFNYLDINPELRLLAGLL